MSGSFPAGIIDREFQISAPAKVNLRLKVCGRQSDGRHLLSMLNVPVSLNDALFIRISKGSGITLEVSAPAAPGFPKELHDPAINLAARAAELFLQHLSISVRVHIRLIKRIPSGAGLAGGSSDGAAVLRCLGSMLAGHLAATQGITEGLLKDQLYRLAEQLGADIPYLLAPGFGYVTGIGERVEYLDHQILSGKRMLLILPQEPVSTAAVFETLRRTRPELPFSDDAKAASFAVRAHSAGERPLRELKGLRDELFSLMENDLTPFSAQTSGAVGEILGVLGELDGAKASLSGSGGAIFCMAQPDLAEDGYRQLGSLLNKLVSPLGGTVIETTVLANSPLFCKV